MIKMLKVLNIYSFSRVDSSAFREVVSNEGENNLKGRGLIPRCTIIVTRTRLRKFDIPGTFSAPLKLLPIAVNYVQAMPNTTPR